MKWLITGFEPFGAHDVNPSAQLVAALGKDVLGAVLPVSFQRARRRLEQLLEEHEPDAALLLGLAADRNCVSFESFARNGSIADALDNDGARASRGPIVAGGEDVVRASLPLDATLAAFRTAGVALEGSTDAGGYVCNHTFYAALHFANTRGTPKYVGFLHVPRLEPGSEEFGRVLEAIRRIITG